MPNLRVAIPIRAFATRGQSQEESSCSESASGPHHDGDERARDHLGLYVLPKHRVELLNWLHQITLKYSPLEMETYFQAVALLDLYTKNRKNQEIPLEIFQCLGCACWWIAIKNCIFVAPRAGQLSALSCGGFSIHELLKMEIHVLNAINWSCQVDTPLQFLFSIISSFNGTGSDVTKMWTDENEDSIHIAVRALVVMQKDKSLASLPNHIQAISSLYSAKTCLGEDTQELRKVIQQWTTKERQILQNTLYSLETIYKLPIGENGKLTI